MNKSQIEVQTLFYILMVLIFVGILAFGFQKFFLVQGELSKQELQEVKLEIQDILSSCDDPLNKGNIYTKEIKNDKFNTVCMLSGDGDQIKNYFESLDFLVIQDAQVIDDIVKDGISIKVGGDNVVLLRMSMVLLKEGRYSLANYDILDSFYVNSELTECFSDVEGKGSLEIRLVC